VQDQPLDAVPQLVELGLTADQGGGEEELAPLGQLRPAQGRGRLEDLVQSPGQIFGTLEPPGGLLLQAALDEGRERGRRGRTQAAEASEAGENGRLLQGQLIENLAPGVRRWLERNGQL
jgi:hypothetical protein